MSEKLSDRPEVRRWLSNVIYAFVTDQADGEPTEAEITGELDALETLIAPPAPPQGTAAGACKACGGLGGLGSDGHPVPAASYLNISTCQCCAGTGRTPGTPR